MDLSLSKITLSSPQGLFCFTFHPWHVAMEIIQEYQAMHRRGDPGGRILQTLRLSHRLILLSRWWFQRFFIFTPIWGRFPI